MSLKPWWDFPAYDDPKYDNALDEAHLAAFLQAVTNVLSTDIAESTFAQIVDGLPLLDVVYLLRRYGLDENETVYKHTQLCPGVLEETRAFRAAFDPGTLQVRADVMDRYQSVPVGSKASKMPLVELIAVAVHTIAANLSKEIGGGRHKNSTYPSDEWYEETACRKRPTPFSLWRYDEPERYPDGIADITGYWAEDQIFGGIVLFDRGESGTEQRSVWFHSSRQGITDHVYALKDEQIASLLLFLESEQGTAACPFPILGDRDSVRRDWRISMPKYNIYRDRWGRRILHKSYWWFNLTQNRYREPDEDRVENPEWGHENEP